MGDKDVHVMLRGRNLRVRTAILELGANPIHYGESISMRVSGSTGFHP